MRFCDNVSNVELSQDVIDELVFMREEEKLARDVYLTLAEKYGDEVPVFDNIAKSEQVHMDAIGILLEKYDIEDPVKSDEVGVFTNPELQELYNTLVEQGSNSLEDALNVGLLIETKDIEDLENAISDSENYKDIVLVYSHLERGSEHHESAFSYWLDQVDSTTEDAVDTVVDTTVDTITDDLLVS